MQSIGCCRWVQWFMSYNHKKSGGRGLEDHGLMPTQANSSQETSSLLIKAGCGGLHLSLQLPGKHKLEDLWQTSETLSQKPSTQRN
jgi:hypothetical protein